MFLATVGGGARAHLTGGVEISDSDSVTQSGAAQPGLVIGADGNAYASTPNTIGAPTTQLAPATDWLRPAAIASTYAVRATVLAGGMNFGAFGEWLAMTQDRAFALYRATNGVATASIRIELSPDGGSTIVATATYSFRATVSFA